MTTTFYWWHDQCLDPDKQFLSQMKQLKLTFLHVDGGFNILIWLLKIVKNFSDAVELQTADQATIAKIILLMTRLMPGPWQTISQSDETIEVDISTRGWWFQHFDLVTQNCGKLFRCRRVANSRPILLQKSFYWWHDQCLDLDKQFLSQMKQLKFTFLHVDGGFSINLVTQNCRKLSRCLKYRWRSGNQEKLLLRFLDL